MSELEFFNKLREYVINDLDSLYELREDELERFLLTEKYKSWRIETEYDRILVTFVLGESKGWRSFKICDEYNRFNNDRETQLNLLLGSIISVYEILKV